MWCMRCNHELSDCTCPDRQARIDATAEVMAVKWCRACNHHYRVCTCAVPDFTVMCRGQDIGRGPHTMLDGTVIVVDPHER